MLERALPELAEAVARRRADPHDARAPRTSCASIWWSVCATSSGAIEQVAGRRCSSRTRNGCCSPRSSSTPPARMPSRCRSPAASCTASTSAPPPKRRSPLLVGDADLLRAAAAPRRRPRRGAGLRARDVPRLTRDARARCTSLTLARGELDRPCEPASTSSSTASSRCSHRPELTGRDARNLVRATAGARRSLLDGRSSSEHVVERIEHAPRGYLLTQDAGGHRPAGRCSSNRSRRDVEARDRSRRRSATDEWRIEVALRDRPGCWRPSPACSPTSGSTFSTRSSRPGPTAARSRLPCSPSRAGARTARAAALERAQPPQPGWLEEAIAAAFDQPLTSPPEPRRRDRVRRRSVPWYTLCEVRSPDRRGLLHTITVGSPRPAPTSTRHASRPSAAWRSTASSSPIATAASSTASPKLPSSARSPGGDGVARPRSSRALRAPLGRRRRRG